MAGPTSPSLATCVLVLMFPAYFLIGLRIWIRFSRRAWGWDDWSMVATIPPFTVLTFSLLMMAWNGAGIRNDQMSKEELHKGMMWWFIFQTNWCFTMIPLKWSICLTICRIASGRKFYVYSLYVAMAMIFIVLGSTAFYEFASCHPLQYFWNTDIPGGYCLRADIETDFSYALSAVNIVTDWYCALLPIPLIWKVQMRRRLKATVAFMLGLAALASISALVRLGITVNLSAATDFLYNNTDVAIWSYAEPGLGVIVANMPALRPLFEKYVIRGGRSTNDTAPHSSSNKNISAGWSKGTRQRDYVELGAMKNHNVRATETTIQARERSSNSSLDDNDSQRHIVKNDTGIMVNQEIEITSETIPNDEHIGTAASRF